MEYLSAKELADLKIEGLPETRQKIQELAKRQNWQSRPRKGRGGGLEYEVAKLPPEIQAAIHQYQQKQVLSAVALPALADVQPEKPDTDGKHVNAELYDVDLKAGRLTWATPLDLSQYKMPLKTKQIWEEENLVTDVNVVSGSLKLQFAVSRDFPVENTFVSSAIVGSNMEVRATQPFSQKAWTEVWQDTRSGDPILANINTADYPIELTSDGAITERWLMKFVNTTQFQLFGERLGLVAESDIHSDLAPINPATQKPYFRLPALAIGGGFATQNCVRFNTVGTPLPVWVVRAVQPSANREIKRDGFALCLRGNTIEK